MKIIRKFGIGLLLTLWAVLSLSLWFGPKTDYTYAERRKLAQMPELSVRSILWGEFMEDFEDFTLDQFPMRDAFRKLKAQFHDKALNQADNNGIYLVDDVVAKIEYPLNENSVSYVVERLEYAYDTYLKATDCKIYTSVIPDKGYYLAAQNGYPSMDYAAMFDIYRPVLSWARYVEITDLLDPNDYYRTDTHWRQERIYDVAQRLLERMDAPVPALESYTPEVLEKPFYGVYFGQAALPMEPEEMVVLRNQRLAECRVFDFMTGEYTAVYNMDKLESPDLYDVYLSGGQPLLTIENPNAQTDRELIIFRDSFGSAIAPLLVSDYSKVTLVDLRYVPADQLGYYLSFDDQDVLFLYSTLILNSGRSLK